MFAAGAGRIGQYNECSFRIPGNGTFFGTESTNPTVGQKGRREEVSEWRLEVICPAERVDAVLTAMRRAHAYEEPAYDVYPLKPQAANSGEGRRGLLPNAAPLGELARTVQKVLGAGAVQMVGDAANMVQSVAIVCGAGGEMMSNALAAKADVFLTGRDAFPRLPGSRGPRPKRAPARTPFHRALRHGGTGGAVAGPVPSAEGLGQ